MGLKAYLETLDQLPEALKEFYVEKDGKFILDAEGVEDVSGLKSALSKERTARATAETKLNASEAKVRAFTEAGITDPVQTAESLKKLAELSSFDPNKEAEKIAETKYLAREKQLIQKHQAEVDGAIKKAEKVFVQLKTVMVDAVATKAIADAKGAVELLLPHIQNRARLREDGERFFVEVLDEAGNPKIGDSSGNLQTIDQLVAEMKASSVFGRAFEASGASGSGGPGDGGRPKGSTSSKTMTREALAKGGANLEDLISGKVTLSE
jgi:hypothetical protein